MSRSAILALLLALGAMDNAAAQEQRCDPRRLLLLEVGPASNPQGWSMKVNGHPVARGGELDAVRGPQGAQPRRVAMIVDSRVRIGAIAEIWFFLGKAGGFQAEPGNANANANASAVFAHEPGTPIMMMLPEGRPAHYTRDACRLLQLIESPPRDNSALFNPPRP